MKKAELKKPVSLYLKVKVWQKPQKGAKLAPLIDKITNISSYVWVWLF